jgi:hypothetical protein
MRMVEEEKPEILRIVTSSRTYNNKNSKNKRIFEVLWTVDAVLRLSESYY